MGKAFKMGKARDLFLDILKKNRAGKAQGIYSICSAHPLVLQAGMLQAQEDDSLVLIESTSNQVDQFGGYTGMKPANFVQYIYEIAGKTGFQENRILLGGDHLGPNAWQKEEAKTAMARAGDLIKSYVMAGFEKIHLDASMFCADDQGDRRKPLEDKIVAERASRLCEIAEKTWQEYRENLPKPLYVIGTEVPVPGGAKEEEERVKATKVEDVNKTIAVAREAFSKKGLDDAWSRVVGVVVQPGVEFGHKQIFDYDRGRALKLSRNIERHDSLVYEAHSTDYQTEESLRHMVEDHFCILKVGPWVTFAYREAVFALADIEQELLAARGKVRLSNLKQTLEQIMLHSDKYWKKYYPGTEQEKSFARKYSLSDRSRYYWPDPLLQQSVKTLIQNLSDAEIPVSLLSQYLPNQYKAVREGRVSTGPQGLIIDRIRDVLCIYSRACGFGRGLNIIKKGVIDHEEAK